MGIHKPALAKLNVPPAPFSPDDPLYKYGIVEAVVHYMYMCMC